MAALNQYCMYLRVLLAKAMDSMIHGIGAPPPRERLEDAYKELVVVERPRGALYNIYSDMCLLFGHGPTRVDDRLWVGSAVNAADRHFVKSVPIEGIVNVTPEVPAFFRDEGVRYHQIVVRDDLGCEIPREVFEGAASFVDRVLRESAGGHVLVHCFVGRSRSVALCCYYRMTRRGETFSEAYRHISAVRGHSRINERFASALRSM